MIYAIAIIFILAFIATLRSGAKNEVKKDIAEAKVEEITKTIKDANAIEEHNATLSDDQLLDKLRGSTD